MSIETIFYGSLSVGMGSFRYTVVDSPDHADCVDLHYEEYDPDTGRWKSIAQMDALELDTLRHILSAATKVTEWVAKTNDEDLQGTTSIGEEARTVKMEQALQQIAAGLLPSEPGYHDTNCAHDQADVAEADLECCRRIAREALN